MSHMKIVPLIAAAAEGGRQAHAEALADLRTLLESHFAAIRYDTQLLKNHHSETTHNAVTQQRASRALYHLIHELQQRVDRLEGEGGTPASSG